MAQVIVIWSENTGLGQTLSGAPYELSLVSPYTASTPSTHTKYQFCNNLGGVGSPSLPNYIGMSAGTTFGVPSTSTKGVTCDFSPHGQFTTTNNIFSQCAANGKTWKTYEEGLYNDGLGGTASQQYWTGQTLAYKHNPGDFYSYTFPKIDTPTTTVGTTNVRSDFLGTNGLTADIAAGKVNADFCWITGNLDNCGHNTSITFFDNWLQGFTGANGGTNYPGHFPGLTALIGAMRDDGVIIIGDDAPPSPVYYCFVTKTQPVTAPAVFTTAGSHYNVLYGIQKYLFGSSPDPKFTNPATLTNYSFPKCGTTGTDALNSNYTSLTSAQAAPVSGSIGGGTTVNPPSPGVAAGSAFRPTVTGGGNTTVNPPTPGRAAGSAFTPTVTGSFAPVTVNPPTPGIANASAFSPAITGGRLPTLPPTNDGRVHLAQSMHGGSDLPLTGQTFNNVPDWQVLARAVDFIVGSATGSKYGGFESQMRSANPDIRLGIYFRGPCENNDPGFPEAWFMHTDGTGTSGNRLILNGSELVMNTLITSPNFSGQAGFIPYHANLEVAATLASTYDMFYLDESDSFPWFAGGHLNGTPQVPGSGSPGTTYTWNGANPLKPAQISMMNAVKAANPTAVGEANLLGNYAGNTGAGGDYTITDLTGLLTLYQSEAFLGSESNPVTQEPTNAQWLTATQAVVNLNAAGIGVHGRVGGTGGTTADNDAKRLYALATAFICDRGKLWIDPRLDLTNVPEVQKAIWQTNLGAPLSNAATITPLPTTGALRTSGGTQTYARTFTSGLALLVTDDTTSRTVTLDHLNYQLNGVSVGPTVVVAPNSGLILTLPNTLIQGTITSPVNGSSVNGPSVTATFGAASGGTSPYTYTISYNGGASQAISNPGGLQDVHTYALGSNTIVLKTTDSAGATGTATSTFTVTLSLAAGSSHTVAVTYRPQVGDPTGSTQSANLIFTDNSGGVAGSQQAVTVFGTIAGLPVATFSQSPGSTIDFGTAVGGSTTDTRQLILTNTGGQNLVVTGITLSGGAPSKFNLDSESGGAFPITLAPGSSNTTTISFRPGLTDPGGTAFTTNLTVTDNNGGIAGSTQAFVLTGAVQTTVAQGDQPTWDSQAIGVLQANPTWLVDAFIHTGIIDYDNVSDPTIGANDVTYYQNSLAPTHNNSPITSADWKPWGTAWSALIVNPSNPLQGRMVRPITERITGRGLVSGVSTSGSAPPTVTTLNLLVVPVERTAAGTLVGTQTDWAAGMARVKVAWESSSWGIYTLNYTFAPKITIAGGVATNDPEEIRGKALPALSLASPSTHWWTYDAILYYTAPDDIQRTVSMGETFVGGGVLGPTYPTSPGGFNTPQAVAHELGHVQGLNHSGAIDINPFLGAATLAAVEDEDPSNTASQYGDQYCIMGGNDYICQLNMLQRHQFGWVDSTRIQLISADGSYTVGHREAANHTNPQALVVQGQSGLEYWIEYVAAGATEDQDSTIPSGVTTPNGVNIRVRGFTASTTTNLVLLRSFLLHQAGFSDATPQYQAGQSFTDPGGGTRLTISVTSAGVSSAVIAITHSVAPSLIPEPNWSRPDTVTDLAVNLAASDSTHVHLTWTPPADATGSTFIHRDGALLVGVPSGLGAYVDTITPAAHTYIVTTSTAIGVEGPPSNLAVWNG